MKTKPEKLWVVIADGEHARVVTPAPVPSNAAEVTVRSYIEALRSGDPQQAAAYLGNGSVDETFINAGTRIVSMHTAREADGSFVVAVQLQTANGNYLETFDVSSPADGSKSNSKKERPESRSKHLKLHKEPRERVVLVKVSGRRPKSRFEALRGRAGKGLSTDEIMALTRGEPSA